MGVRSRVEAEDFLNIKKIRFLYTKGLCKKAFYEFYDTKEKYGRNWHAYVNVSDLFFLAKLNLQITNHLDEFEEIRAFAKRKLEYDERIDCKFDQIKYRFLSYNPDEAREEYYNYGKSIFDFPDRVRKATNQNDEIGESYMMIGKVFMYADQYKTAKDAFIFADTWLKDTKLQSENSFYRILNSCLEGDQSEVKRLSSNYISKYRHNKIKVILIKAMPSKYMAGLFLPK